MKPTKSDLLRHAEVLEQFALDIAGNHSYSIVASSASSAAQFMRDVVEAAPVASIHTAPMAENIVLLNKRFPFRRKSYPLYKSPLED